MPFYQCLSVCGPCAEICAACKKSADDYEASEIAKKTQESIRWLEYQGYKVTKS